MAGVVLGNEVGKLGMSKARMLDYCLMIGLPFFCLSCLVLTIYRATSGQCCSSTLWRIRGNLLERPQS